MSKKTGIIEVLDKNFKFLFQAKINNIKCDKKIKNIFETLKIPRNQFLFEKINFLKIIVVKMFIVLFPKIRKNLLKIE